MKATADAVGGFNLMKFMGVIVISVMGFSVLFTVRHLPSDGIWTVVQARNQKVEENEAAAKDDNGDELLPRGIFDEKSCLSRYESLLYRRGLPRIASPDLISKLRSYEGRHKKCAHSYNLTLKDLKSTTYDCKYIVWISMNGLGNQMLSLASTFLYALLTDRVLLLDRGVGIPDLFCEPFPEASWLLPRDFPFNSGSSHQSYGKLLRRNNISGSATASPPKPYIYLHLSHDYDDHDKRFFCDQDQAYLHNIPWLILRSDLYFVPPLFLMSSFQQELDKLFPEKDTVFHFLGRYLFHPTNSVWGLVTRYYRAYLSNAHVITGIQIRVFQNIRPLLEQILSCTMTTETNILPQIMTNNQSTNNTNYNTTVAVLMTSLSSGYYEQIREMYLENPTATGEVVGVFQPSHEEFQQTGKHSHNRKALAEIYLLSFADKLVTSGWSTFGYVAQGLGGLKPWILYKPESGVAPEPPCRRAMSMEPCFHRPRSYYCKTRIGGVAPVPHVRQCEVTMGVKLA